MRDDSKPVIPGEPEAPSDEAARKRVAVEMVARHERALRRTARRYSICTEDAEDAFQRALEILLLKAPPGDARELVRWMQTVTKHEALAVRRGRERQMGPVPQYAEDAEDWIAQLPSQGVGPAERAERRESMARSREALKALKPAELRALTLLAEGYSYVEIGEITGFSQTKVNRCLAEGREAYRAMVAHCEAGGRCEDLRSTLSAFCDGEASAQEAAVLREHLRACAHCRAAMRAYRAAPGAAAALAPLPLVAPSLFERAQEALAGLQARFGGRLPGGAAEAANSGLAASGGASGVGIVAAAKTLAICAGAAGGAAACIGTGVVPSPLGATPDRAVTPGLIRPADPPAQTGEAGPLAPAPALANPPEQSGDEVDASAAAPVDNGGVEYAPAKSTPPVPAAPPVDSAPVAAAPGADAAGSPAGEFGP